MAYLHKWSPISYRSRAGQGKLAGQGPTLCHCATQPTTNLCTPIIPFPADRLHSLRSDFFRIPICTCLAEWMIPSAACRCWRLNDLFAATMAAMLSETSSQTASRSVQQFLSGSLMLCCTMHCQWGRTPKLPLSLWI